MTHDAAWILPGSDYNAVILPDGSRRAKMDVAGSGITICRWPSEALNIMPHPESEDLVLTAERNVTMKRSVALANGFELVAPTKSHLKAAWRSAIMKSPEASDRPSAAAELLSTQSSETLSVESARAFLRGLPTEQREEPTPVTTNHQPDPRAARLAEIEMSMAAYNRGKGRGHGRGGQSLEVAKSLADASADPVKLKRMTEIRANAIALRIQQGEAHLTSEYKNLNCVLQAHDQTGAPLATLMGQMGIDASKIMTNIGA
jgi:hypothetical protein